MTTPSQPGLRRGCSRLSLGRHLPLVRPWRKYPESVVPRSMSTGAMKGAVDETLSLASCRRAPN